MEMLTLDENNIWCKCPMPNGKNIHMIIMHHETSNKMMFDISWSYAHTRTWFELGIIEWDDDCAECTPLIHAILKALEEIKKNMG